MHKLNRKKFNHFVTGLYGTVMYDHNKKFIISLIDNEDVKKIDCHGYFMITKNGYVLCNNTSTYLHNLIMGIKEHSFNAEVDHIDRNKLHNRKNNLRVVSRQINNLNIGMQKNNTSGYKGVAWHKQHKKWRAYIMLDYKQKHLGLFDNKEDAYKARLIAEYKILNVLLDEYKGDSYEDCK